MTKKELKIIIDYISNKYDIPIDFLEKELNDILNKNTTSNNEKCVANIFKDNKVTQCTRSKSCGNFCKTHFRQNEENKLKYGIIKITNNKIDLPKQILKDKKNYIELEYFTKDNKDYLFNCIKREVYDFKTKKYIGKLDFDLNIIKVCKQIKI